MLSACVMQDNRQDVLSFLWVVQNRVRGEDILFQSLTWGLVGPPWGPWEGLKMRTNPQASDSK